MILGLTGGIAVGKSTVRECLASQFLADVFDADKCVHRLLDTDAGLGVEIGRLFGPEYLQSDGRPDRGALRGLVFKDADARRRLETVLHPRVRAEWLAGRERCLASGGHYLADIPLLYETGAEPFFDVVLVVACSLATQMSRLRGRGLDSDTAQAMLASQLPLGQKVDRASFVIWNDGTLASLGRQIQLVTDQLFPV
ncbi:MAG: Dephospho-CoA kinase [Verrucomicrobiota bacterium]|jgi:dephospho-CoA kinase